MRHHTPSRQRVPTSPTEEQIASALKPLERGVVRGDPHGALAIEVEYHVPDVYQRITGWDRAKLVARLINELNADADALKDCHDDEARLMKAKAFFKTPEGELWMEQRMSKPGNDVIMDTQTSAPLTSTTCPALQMRNVAGELGGEIASSSAASIEAVHPELSHSFNHGPGQAISGPSPFQLMSARSMLPSQTRPQESPDSNIEGGNGHVMVVGVESQSQPNHLDDWHSVNGSRYPWSNSNDQLPLHYGSDGMVYSNVRPSSTVCGTTCEQSDRQTVAFVFLIFVIVLIFMHWFIFAGSRGN